MDDFEKARFLIAGGDYMAAMRQYEMAEKQSPGDERVLCGVALVHLMENRLGEAAECMTKILEARPDAPYPCGIIGAIASENHSAGDAKIMYDAMMLADPSEAAAYVRKAQILLGEGLEKESADVIRECAKISDPRTDTPMEAERLSRILESVKAGRAPALRAIDSVAFVPGLSALLDRAIGDWLPRLRISLEEVKLGGAKERADAVKILSGALEARPDPGALCVLGELLHDLERTSDSVACYERAMKQSPGDMMHYVYKIGVLQEAGDDAGAAECLDEALKTTPKDEPNAELQKMLRLRRDVPGKNPSSFSAEGMASAVKWHVARRRRFPPQAGSPAPRAAELARDPGRKGKTVERGGADAAFARKAFLRMRKQIDERHSGKPAKSRRAKSPEVPFEQDPDAALARAAAMFADDEPDEAMREYEKAEKQSPLDERVLCGMALAHMWRGNRDKIAEYVKQLRAVRPGAGYPHGITGIFMDELGSQDFALRCYDLMIAADPGEVSAYVRKAMILRRKGMEKECSDTIKECLDARWSGRESPKEKRRLREMGENAAKGERIAFKTHDSGTFLPGLWEMLDLAFGPDRISPDGPDGKSDFEGIRLAGKGDLQAGLEWAEHAYGGGPQSALTWSTKGMLLAEDGRVDEAVACYERAAELDPGGTLPYSCKANLLADEGNLKGARECIREALSYAPPNPACAGLQEELAGVLKALESGGEWPQVRSSQVVMGRIRWAAGRRSKKPGGRGRRRAGGTESLFPAGGAERRKSGRLRAGRRR